VTKCKKGIAFFKIVWYNIIVIKREQKARLKKILKDFKKVLTNGSQYAIINMSVRERYADKTK
jgi:hypothetical protein